MPNAVSPKRCKMNGDKKMPVAMSTPSENQLEPTFLIINRLSILLILQRHFQFRLLELTQFSKWLAGSHPRGNGLAVQFLALQFVSQEVEKRRPCDLDL